MPSTTPVKKISDRQKTANQRNAQKSTGPTSEEGKAVSRENATKHGLATRRITLPDEDVLAYHELRAGLIRDWRPAGTQELMLVEQIAQSYWRIQRARSVETRMFALSLHAQKSRNGLDPNAPHDDDGGIAVLFIEQPEKYFGNYHRFEAKAELAYYRALDRLTRLQKDRVAGRLGHPAYERTVEETEPRDQPQAAATAGAPEPQAASNTPKPAQTQPSENGNGFVVQTPQSRSQVKEINIIPTSKEFPIASPVPPSTERAA